MYHSAAGPMCTENFVLPPRTMETSEPKLLLLSMTESMVLLQLESVLMSIAHVTTGAQVNSVVPCVEV